ncbi:MAG: CBS domain-containing protein [Deltaproteobacteria bacterium]|nr:CBS domain-containing protein [Deltaproteobacteria bacterium]
MLVKNWMNPNVTTIDKNESLQQAMKLMKHHHIKMLPVMKKGKLVGVVTDRDIKRASASDATLLEIHELMYLLAEIKIEEIMTSEPITVPPDYTVEETAEILFKNDISGVPVMDGTRKIVGTITKTDLFRVLISLTGFGARGIQFALIVEDRPGSIKEVADIIRGYSGRMASILSTYENVAEGFRKVYIRMYEIDRARLALLKEDIRKKATLLYLVDHRNNLREIYS